MAIAGQAPDQSDTLPLTQEFLAQMLGVRRTTVTIEARKLQEAGLIKYQRGHIHIIDAEGLEDQPANAMKQLTAIFVGSVVRRRISTNNGRPNAEVPARPRGITSSFLTGWSSAAPAGRSTVSRFKLFELQPDIPAEVVRRR